MSGVPNEAFELDDKEENKLTRRKVPDVTIEHNNGLELDIPNGNTTEEVREETKKERYIRCARNLILNGIFIGIFIAATVKYIENDAECNKQDEDVDFPEIKECSLTLCSPYGMIIFVTAIAYSGLIYYFVIKEYFGESINQNLLKPLGRNLKNLYKSKVIKIVSVLIVIAAIAGYIVYETHTNFRRLQSLSGIALAVVIGFVFSKHRRSIRWRPVLCGSLFQFLLGVFCIRWDVGREIFTCFGAKVAEFLAFSVEGAAFVFGDFLVRDKGVFAFYALPTIFFFSLCISILYYLNAMQWFLLKAGWILQSIVGTTVCESMTAAANIFLGMSESPLIIRPYIKYLTKSELHSIMTSGFATVSGTTFAAYISFGAEPSHLITASVMAAPATLFYSKLFYPETEQSKTTSSNLTMEKSADTSLLDAASNGANQGINLILGIIANLVAFVAFIAFADGMIKWVTFLLGFDDLGIQEILGKIFIPLAWSLGVDWEDCELVAQVIGTKTIVNEFVAFQRLGVIKKAGSISLRSSAIATYAICGFANPSSMGIMIGALSALCPEKRGVITEVAFRAFVGGCFVCFITASIAGLLMTDDMIQGQRSIEIMSNFTM